MKAILISTLVLFSAGALPEHQPSAGQPVVAHARFEALAPSAGLEAALRQARSRASEPLWIGYSVPMVTGMGRVCCFNAGFQPSVCLLEGKNGGWGSKRDHLRGEQTLQVLLRFQGGAVDEIRGLSADCELDAGGRPFVWLGAVRPEESIAYLAGLARSGEDRRGKGTEEAISTLAAHRDPRTDAALEELTASRYPMKKREQALFWLGQTRGEHGARFLESLIQGARTEKDDEVLEKAVFSLSQSPVPWAAQSIIRTAKEHRSPHIRGQALFWLAQMKTAEAPEIIVDAISKDPAESVRKEAVFALSQLHGRQGVSFLLKVARESRDPLIRKEAFFWLAQSKDPEALAYLDKMLNND